MNYPLNMSENEPVLTRMNRALNYHMNQKCADLAVLFDRGTKQDLQTIFPILIDNIFGLQGTYSWDLRAIHADIQYNEFTNVINFLKPQGSLFKLIYSLLKDPHVKYEFSVAYLPYKIRANVDTHNIHPFYSDVLQFSTQPNDKQPVCLLLNPFDYYMFHFAYHLISPNQQRDYSEDKWNSAYYNLCAEYLLHFFPIGTDNTILPSIPFYHGKDPAQNIQHFQRSHKHSSLLKANLFGDPQSVDVKMMHQHLEKHPRNEIWRSETLLMAIMDFWLSNDQVITYLNYSRDMDFPVNFRELPSGDYIRIVRVAVKHLHAFTSTASIDTSPLGELRKHAMPMLQSRMYLFLRNLFCRWPLDESFRLVLELWLSFIQPWRYSHELYNQRGGIHKSSSTQVLPSQTDPKQADESYMPFIAENLLVYVVILRQLLPRFSRVDLTSPKNAQMLYRLTKVFNQPNLVHMLKTVESILESSKTVVQQTLNCSSILPPFSPTKNAHSQIFSSTHLGMDHTRNYGGADVSAMFNNSLESLSNKYLNLVRQKIIELESTDFPYKPLFICGSNPEVYELLSLVKESEVKAVAILDEIKERRARAKAHRTLWESFLQNFVSNDDLEDIMFQARHKAPMFLSYSAENLMEIFGLKHVERFESNEPAVKNSSGSDQSLGHGQNYQSENFGTILTPTRVKERLNNVKYEGDPDLMPIQSYEVAFLVRLFYIVATKINQKYGGFISDLFYNDGVLGNFSRHFLQEPRQIYQYEKKRGMSRRQMYNLPPRLSLRSLSNQRFLYFICIGTFLSCYVLRLSVFAFSFACLIWYVFKALWRSVFFSNRISTGNVQCVFNPNLSLNDSLDE